MSTRMKRMMLKLDAMDRASTTEEAMFSQLTETCHKSELICSFAVHEYPEKKAGSGPLFYMFDCGLLAKDFLVHQTM